MQDQCLSYIQIIIIRRLLVMFSDEEGLRNGFVEVAQLDKHNLTILGIRVLIWAADPNNENSRKRKLILSWDEKNIFLWEHGKLLRQLKVSGADGRGIGGMAFIPAMRVFVVATAQMKFIFYDYSLKVLETVSHGERMVTGLEYDSKKGHLIMSGSGGMSVWKVIKKQLERRNTYILEKLFAFDDFSNWSHRIRFEPETGNIYALDDNKLTVLRNDTKKIIDRVEQSSAAPITQCCWYEKSKFYLVANASGELRCWSPGHQTTSTGKGDPETTLTTCVLRHSLRPHTRAITGLAVHPSSDLVYSAGVDTLMKITNMETLTETFSLSMHSPITHFTLMPGSFGSDYLCVMGLQNSIIRVWTSKKCSDTVVTLDSVIVHMSPHIFPAYLDKECNTKSVTRRRKLSSYLSDDNENSDQEDDVNLAEAEEGARLDAGAIGDDAYEDNDDQAADDTTDDTWSSRPQTAAYSEISGDNKYTELDDEGIYLEGRLNLQFSRNTKEQGYFLCQTSHNMRVWQSNGKLVSIIGEDALVDGVKSYAISIKMKTLYCLMDDRSLRMYNLDKEPNAGTHVEDADVPTRVLPGSYFGVVDFPCCITIVDCIPVKSGAKDADSRKPNQEDINGDLCELKGSVDELRQNLMAADDERADVVHDESLVIGGSIGTFRWLDTASSLREIATTDVAAGSISSMLYNSHHKRVYAYATSLRDSGKGNIHIFNLPDVALLYVIEKLERISCWNISVAHPYVAMGTSDGYVRLYHLLGMKHETKLESKVDKSNINKISLESEPSALKEVDITDDSIAAAGDVFEVILGDTISLNNAQTILPLSGSSIHAGKVTSISFCESLECLATSSLDFTIRIWSLDKILLQSVKFDYPVTSICFSPYHGIGDLVVAQQYTSLLLKSKTLDLEVLLSAAVLLKEDWLQATLSENISEVETHFMEANLKTATASTSGRSSVKSASFIMQQQGLPGLSSSKFSRDSSRRSSNASRPGSTGSFSRLFYKKPDSIVSVALNVRKPPRPNIEPYKSGRLIKLLPPPKPRGVGDTINVVVSTQSLLEPKNENESAEEVVPKPPDPSAKPSSSSGRMRKRVAFRA